MKSSTKKIKHHLLRTAKLSFATTLGIFLITSCSSGSEKGSASDSLAMETEKDTAAALETIKPTGEAPAWAPDIKPEMQAVIEKL